MSPITFTVDPIKDAGLRLNAFALVKKLDARLYGVLCCGGGGRVGAGIGLKCGLGGLGGGIEEGVEVEERVEEEGTEEERGWEGVEEESEGEGGI
jgi:hypothetical protein